jgi:hypothetical protein
MYAKGQGVAQDYAKAVSWSRKAADQGNAEAQHNLGVMYFKGQGVTQDYAEAVKWFRKAANQGDAEAQKNLADLYARFPALREHPDIVTPGAPVASSPVPPKLGKTSDAATAAGADPATLRYLPSRGTARPNHLCCVRSIPKKRLNVSSIPTTPPRSFFTCDLCNNTVQLLSSQQNWQRDMLALMLASR